MSRPAPAPHPFVPPTDADHQAWLDAQPAENPPTKIQVLIEGWNARESLCYCAQCKAYRAAPPEPDVAAVTAAIDAWQVL